MKATESSYRGWRVRIVPIIEVTRAGPQAMWLAVLLPPSWHWAKRIVKGPFSSHAGALVNGVACVDAQSAARPVCHSQVQLKAARR